MDVTIESSKWKCLCTARFLLARSTFNPPIAWAALNCFTELYTSHYVYSIAKCRRVLAVHRRTPLETHAAIKLNYQRATDRAATAHRACGLLVNHWNEQLVWRTSCHQSAAASTCQQRATVPGLAYCLLEYVLSTICTMAAAPLPTNTGEKHSAVGEVFCLIYVSLIVRIIKQWTNAHFLIVFNI